jgi:transcriptional regulator with XRE-family HTH domain
MDKRSRTRFAKKIKKLRGGRSQAEFASLLGVSQPCIGGWEKGEIPTIENLEKLAKLAQEFPEQFLASLYGRSVSVNESVFFNELINNMGREELAEIILMIGNRLKTDENEVKISTVF